ncbi:ABC transporter permease [Virgibacillus sp. NKC19-3]|uniref:ABC transporter permease n=1 Tax=Virgibacillus saliphilus TaxID=2831674 RepID=UPI001C9A89DA|nr:ABC transporter permease [Virgibacillus sp. NKC19-3]MBY7142980.1 ABC transporter permease [Virgibacillus sp. NKC19-3]
MLDFFWKDVKLMWRDPTELLMLLAMPFILIVILGFALGGVMNNPSIELHVAMVDQDDEETGMERFERDLASASLPAELSEIAAEIAPKSILQQTMEEDLRDVLTVTAMTEEEAVRALEEGEVEAILTIPEAFSYDNLRHMLLGESVQTTLSIKKAAESQLSGDIFQNMIEQFVHTMNLQSSYANIAMGEEPDLAMEEVSRQETVTERDPISSMEYYTIGMAVMFAFFVASTMSAKSKNELEEKVVNRILLTGQHPLSYLMGKVMATIVIAFIQVSLIISLSSIGLQAFRPYEGDIIAKMLLILLLYALAVGALGSLMIALTVRFEAQSLQEIFSVGVVTILAMLGGSFFPTAGLPDLVKTLGAWTPNGAAMKAFMLTNQGLPMNEIAPYLGRLVLFALVIFLISIMVFPKRRVQA